MRNVKSMSAITHECKYHFYRNFARKNFCLKSFMINLHPPREIPTYLKTH